MLIWRGAHARLPPCCSLDGLKIPPPPSPFPLPPPPSPLLPSPFCSDGCFISTTYDATSHFETEIEDVLSMYRRITGKELDLEKEDLRKRQEAQ
jgi:hypothetical protein